MHMHIWANLEFFVWGGGGNLEMGEIWHSKAPI